MALRTTLLLIILINSVYGYTQVTDNFSDGDFTNDPIWSGDDSYFVVTEENRLNSNGPSDAASVLHLSTVSSVMDYTIWEFLLDLNFNGTTSNFFRIYLTSDKLDQEDNPTGYFIQMGQTSADYIKLFRNDAGTVQEIAQGTTGFSSSIIGEVRIRVIRDVLGNWTIYADPNGAQDFQLEASVLDNTYTSTNYFGVYFQYSTTSRYDDFGFDDLVISQLEMDTVEVLSATEVVVYFNQPIDQTDAETTGSYTLPGYTVSSATQSSVSDSVVTLTLDGGTPLVTGDYTLTVTSALTRNSDATYDFSYTQLQLQSALTLSETEMLLTFNDDLEETSAETLTNYTIDNGIGQPAGVSLNEDRSQVTLTLSNSLYEGTTFELTLSGIENEIGNSVFAGTEDFTFVIPVVIDSAAAQSQSTVLVMFNKPLNETIAEDVLNYSLSGGLGNPISATLQDGSQSVELTFSENLADDNYVLTINDVEDLDGNIIAENSTISFSYLHLDIVSVVQVGDESVRITFNQEVDESTAEMVGNYSLSEMGSPTLASHSSEDLSEVTLTWDELYNSVYTLSITGISNQIQNSEPSELSAQLAISKASDYRQLLITEIMADPTPVVGLPDAEYVEIYNPGSFSINLEGFELNDEPLDSFILQPGAYALLTDDSNLAAFGVTNGIAITSFDALTNSGETVYLRDQFGNLLDSVTYALSWYRSDAKDDGGYALELMDPLQPCSDSQNWIASVHSNGGTPGVENSVFDDQDTSTPQLLSVTALSDNQLTVVFSEPMEASSVTTESFDLEGYAFTTVSAVSYTTFSLQLSADLISERSYTLTVSNVSDCRGNILTDQNISFYHDTRPPQFSRVQVLTSQTVALIFSEPLNEAIAEDEANYSITGYTVDQALLQDSATHRVHVSFNEEFELEANYSLTYSQLEDTLGNALVTANASFEYQDQIDTAYVVAPNLLALRFTEALESTSATSFVNYWLEDVKSRPVEIALSESDPKLVHLAFGANFSENKDLRIFVSNIKKSVDNSSLITPAYTFKYDTRAATIASLLVKNDSQLIITWSEPMEVQTATTSSYYELEDDEQPIEILQLSDTEYELTFANQFEMEVQKRLSAKGMKDRYGVEVTTTRNVDFTYDPRPPSINEVRLIDPDRLKISFSEKVSLGSATSLTNYTIEGENPLAAELLGPDSAKVVLTFSSIESKTEGQLIAIGLSDQVGNISDSDTILVNTQNPNMVSLVPETDSSFVLTYSHSMNPVAFEKSSYSLDEFTIAEVSQRDDYSAVFTVHEKFTEGDSLKLTSDAIEGANNELVLSPFVSARFTSYFEGYDLLDEQTLWVRFDTEFSSISKTVFTIEGNSISLVNIDPEELGSVRVLLSTPLEPNVPLMLEWAGISDKFGRRLPDYRLSVERDTQKPEVSDLESEYLGKLTLTFTEPMDESSLKAISNYRLLGKGHPAAITVVDDRTALLDFDNGLEVGVGYDLLILPISDVAGNYSVQDTVAFSYQPPAFPAYGDIVINELMIDPSPAVGLPEVEYIELFNASSQAYDLRGLKIGDPSVETILPAYVLDPESYVLIVATSSKSLFSGSNILGISGFPSLGNTGDHVLLKTIFGDLVDDVNYETSWYGDPLKDDGGFSLERIDPWGMCPEGVNWQASTHSLGGSPGEENSGYRTGSDADLPMIEGFMALSTSQFQISFDEPMDSSSLLTMIITMAGFEIEERTVGGDYFTELTFSLSTPVALGETYELEVSGASDCSGNLMEPETISVGFGRAPVSGELIITEIMADPDPVVGLPNSEFIEVYNATDELISLSGVRLRDATSSTTLPDVNVPGGAYFILCPSTQVAAFSPYGLTVGVTSWPSLNNTGEQLSLFKDVTIEAVAYSNKWYSSDEKSDGGYSLEIINPTGSCPGGANWSETTDPSGGTPGRQNSVYSLEPDSEVPVLKSYSTPDELTIRFTFSEPMDSSSLMGAMVEGVNLSSRVVTTADFDELQITLSDPLPKGSLVEITISSASDCSGNLMEPETISVGFGRAPVSGDLIITEIMADPDPVIGLPNSEFIEVYNATDELISLSGVRLRDATSSTTLPDVNVPGGTYFILCPSTQVVAFSSYGLTVGVTSWPSLNNTGEALSLFKDVTIAAVTYSNDWYENSEKSDGGYSLELINPFGICPGGANWSESNDPSGGTPGRQNSVYSLEPDSEAPIVISLEVLDETTIRFTFSESMDSESLLGADITGLSVSETRLLDQDFTILEVLLSSPLPKGVSVEVALSGPSDCSGNPMTARTFVVGLGDIPGFNDLLITEIMADPEPVAGLPNSEFFELYNASDRLLKLKDVELHDATNTVTLPAVVIPPGGYWFFTPSSSLGLYGEVTNQSAVSGWTTLNNTGESLSLWHGSQLVFQITYSDDWHDSDEKSGGGYSLEMKDLSNPCGGSLNWGSSMASAGGTPGRENSNAESVPDNFGPNLIGAFAIAADTLLLIFDEGLNPDFTASIELSFDPELSYHTSFLNADRTEVKVALNGELKVNQSYGLTVKGVTDCNGNEIRKNTASLVLPDEAVADELILNEILFDPRPEGVDFVEVHNRSEKYIDLQGWGIGRLTEDLQTRWIGQRYILKPGGFVAITTDSVIVKNQYPQGVNKQFLQISSLPSLPNDAGTVVLSSPTGEIVDQFSYEDDFHLSFLESVDGVSLERISADGLTQDANNWTSASSAAGYATPGYINSQAFEARTSNARVTIDPKVFVPGSANPAHQSFTTINYQFDKGGQFANITVYNQMGQPVAELARGTSLGTSGFVRWDGTTGAGDRVRMGYYVVFFELYDGSGSKQILKETVVVGR